MKEKLAKTASYSILIKLMHIHNSVYVFLSGIFISLSTNLLTSLCFEPKDFVTNWCIYATIVFSAISGAMFIAIATKLTPIQENIKEALRLFKSDDVSKGDQLQVQRKKSITIDLTKNQAGKWIMMYLALIISTISSLVFTILKFVLFN